ncbi:hypothetical protein OF829_04585 [Sphingomonas sp. LB-2]|uniref:hypothetical protein n=1 Tax=Sphingomonas caeni TaxID=2984949 RepID=UPI0022329845|nr:hypothetical protein [Sphingomonas caeni]MCW3846504.1 hypothetical protein [Sphingomonas caeni]
MSDFLGHLLAQARPEGQPALGPLPLMRFEGGAAIDESGGIDFVAEADPAPGVLAMPRTAAPAAETEPPPQRAHGPVAIEAAAPFAPAPAIETRETDAFQPVLPAPVVTEITTPVIRELSTFEQLLEIVPQSVAPVTQPARDDARDPAPQTIVEQPIAGAPLEPAGAPEPGEQAAAPSPGPAEPGPHAEAGEPLSPLPPPLAAAPLQPQPAPEIAAPIAEPPPLPVVEVHIGRIEIHAPEAPAPVVAAPPAAAAGGSRLDRYLARG